MNKNCILQYKQNCFKIQAFFQTWLLHWHQSTLWWYLMCKTSYIIYFVCPCCFSLLFLKCFQTYLKNEIQNKCLLIPWGTSAASSVLGNTVWKSFSHRLGPKMPSSITLFYSFPSQFSPSNIMHNLFIYYTYAFHMMIHDLYLYMIFIRLVHCCIQLWNSCLAHSWCSINICWMNEFSIFWAFALAY